MSNIDNITDTDTLPDPITVDDAIEKQQVDSILVSPAIDIEAEGNATVTISLVNTTGSSQVYAYINGLSLNDNGAVALLQSDGSTLYLPANPPADHSPLLEDCAILLGAPGTTRHVTIPYLAGGRIWFAIGAKLTFELNKSAQGAALVEPSVSNTSDPNYYINWSFCEFTYNSSQIYANISYVDFVGLPIALTLTKSDGTTESVGGLPADGLATIANGLIAQNAIDKAGWDKLVVNDQSGNLLRVLSPLNGIVEDPTLFQEYFTEYLNAVWKKYITDDLVIDMQATTWSSDAISTTITGNTSNDRTQIYFPSVGAGFTKPSARDIFAADSGAFAAKSVNTAQMLNIGARIDAAINRSTLLINNRQPAGEDVSTYYQNAVTNHYGRIVHATAREGRGYTFPYDDVTGGGIDQSGFVSDGAPRVLLVNVGGGTTPSNTRRRQDKRHAPMMKRSVVWAEDIKVPFPSEDPERDLEKGEHTKLLNETSYGDTKKFTLPPPLDKVFGRYLMQIQSSQLYAQHFLPWITCIQQLVVSFLSLSMRAVLSRIFILAFVMVFYFLGIGSKGSMEELETQRKILEAAGLMNGTFTSQVSATALLSR